MQGRTASLSVCTVPSIWIFSIFRLIHQLVLGDPRHHGAEPAADFLDRVLGG